MGLTFHIRVWAKIKVRMRGVGILIIIIIEGMQKREHAGQFGGKLKCSDRFQVTI